MAPTWRTASDQIGVVIVRGPTIATPTPLRAQLEAKAVGDRLQGELGRMVWATERHRDPAADRADQHHPAAGAA
jgi:hypothetical protein